MQPSLRTSPVVSAATARRDRRALLPAAIERALEWVLSAPIRDADGVLRSWSGGARASFRYPEATGFLVGVLLDLHRRTGAVELLHEARRSAVALAGLAHASGGFGRDRALYAFDSGVCLAAWTRLLALDGSDAHPGVARAARGTALYLHEALVARRAAHLVASGEPLPPRRWSATFGPHQLKAVHALLAAERLGLVADAEASVSVRSWAGEVCARYWHDDHFHWHPEHCASYAHAHCYALEGLLAYRRDGVNVARAAALARAGAEWLGRVQDTSGAIPTWPGAADEPALFAADVTAQAVRIWAVVDRVRFAAPIELALDFLETLTESSGAVRYAATNDERSSWATLFTIQARALARLGPSDDPIA